MMQYEGALYLLLDGSPLCPQLHREVRGGEAGADVATCQ